MRALLPALLLLAACVAGPPRASRRTPAAEGLDPRYLPAFEALGRAVEAGEDEAARQVHDRLEERLDLDVRAGVEGAAEARTMLAAYGRVLGGRERLQALELELVRVEGPRGPAVALRGRTAWHQELALRPGPATVNERLLVLTPDGREVWRTLTTSLGELEELTLRPGEVSELVLLDLGSGHPAGAIATRRTLVLELRSGEVLEGGRAYPASTPRVEPLEHDAIAPWLPGAPVDPRELLRYLERAERPALRPADPAAVPDYELERARFTASLLERAVRIPELERPRALELLAPFVARSSLDEVERVVPALRWLTARSGESSMDPQRWKDWFATRGRLEPRPATSTGSGLDLPRRPRRD